MDNQEQKLRDGILAEARTKADRLLAKARREVAAAMTQAETECRAMRESRIADATRRADVAYRARMARIRQEVRGRWLKRREDLLDDVIRQAAAAVPAPGTEARRESLLALVREALAGIGPGDVEVGLAPADRGALPGTAIAAVAGQTGAGGARRVRVTEDADLSGGVRVVSGDRHRAWDNGLAERAVRLRAELRLAAARALECADDRLDAVPGADACTGA